MATPPKLLADKAMAQIRAGQFNAAFKTARGAAKEHPKESFFPNLCGLALVQGGAAREAIDWFRKALRLMPANVDAQNNLIQTYASLGDTDRALDLIARVLPTRPDRNVLWYLQAMALNAAGRLTEAKAVLDTLIAAYPADARAWNLRGTVRFGLDEELEALADHEQALRLKPASPDVLVNLALLLSRAGQMDAALAAARKARALAPGYDLALMREAVILNEMGQTDAALAGFRAVLALRPDDAEALLETAQIAAGDDLAQVAAQVDKALTRAKVDGTDRAFLLIAKARMALKSGDRVVADGYFAEGNAVHARVRPFDVARAEREMAETLALFPDGYVAPKAPPLPSPWPIFVLGLPRSGTTLIEQVLSSHPDVHGAGELPWIGRAARQAATAGRPFDADAAREFVAAYVRGLPPMPADARAFVDKMPGNYKHLGYIAAALPDAVVISVRRDPRDVALSMWHIPFGADRMAFSFDQRWMARELNEYARVMAHWARLFPGRVVEMHYETLVNDIDGQSRRLAQASGLDWRPGMARPHENTNAVRTASLQQVRQPVSARSVGGWRRHADALADLIAGLDRDLWPDLAD